ncbi:hypothetical protein TNCV_5129101 [Trichonephila clavipes]|nr:hypothetical protein TNCV_5129101 [Trichonephila clavipes]
MRVSGFSFRFHLSSDDIRVREWRPRDKLLNSAFTLQRHTTPTACVMQGYHKTFSITLTPFPDLVDPQICHQSSLPEIIWDGKLDSLRNRGLFTATLQGNVSGHHTELVCLNALSYRIVHSS